MRNSKYIGALALLVGLLGCHKQPDILPGYIKYDIVDANYPKGALPVFEDGLTMNGSKNYDACSHIDMSFGSTRPLTKEAQLRLSIIMPSTPGRYPFTSYEKLWYRCVTDTVGVNVFVEERPVPGGFDQIGLAAYTLLEDPFNYCEVTQYDAERHWIEGNFQIKAIRVGNKGYPLPLADTLVIANGKFGFGFVRE